MYPLVVFSSLKYGSHGDPVSSFFHGACCWETIYCPAFTKFFFLLPVFFFSFQGHSSLAFSLPLQDVPCFLLASFLLFRALLLLSPFCGGPLTLIPEPSLADSFEGTEWRQRRQRRRTLKLRVEWQKAKKRWESFKKATAIFYPNFWPHYWLCHARSPLLHLQYRMLRGEGGRQSQNWLRRCSTLHDKNWKSFVFLLLKGLGTAESTNAETIHGPIS